MREAYSKAAIDATDALEGAQHALRAMSSCYLGAGGYPDEVDEVPGYTIVASVNDDGSPELVIHRNSDLVRWFKRAKTFLKRNPEEDLVTAMFETVG